MTFQIHQNAMVRVPKTVGQRNSKVAVLTVTETVLAEAIRAANGDPGRLEIITPNQIVVWNSRYQREVMRVKSVKRERLTRAGEAKMMLNATYGKGRA